jgi:NADPH-dependent 2,4-dienoyl-CoA reductase/sulfur reductase-like enzyme
LLLLLAWQYLRAGVGIQAVLDLTPLSNHLRALPKLPRALLARHYLTKGLRYKRDLKAAGVRMLHDIGELRALGDEHVETIEFRRRGRLHRLDTRLLLVHFGIVPGTQLTRLAGCHHLWHDGQQCWRPWTGPWQESSIAGTYVTGDASAIGGARAAEHAGRLAAFQALYRLSAIDRKQRDRQAANDRRWLRDDLHIRPFLEAYFRLPRELLEVADDKCIVCRCEEVSAGQVRAAVASGHSDANQVKFLTRCGMGPCQGRQCADSVAHIVAAAGGDELQANGQYRVRPPVTPLTLGQLAAMYDEAAE